MEQILKYAVTTLAPLRGPINYRLLGPDEKLELVQDYFEFLYSQLDFEKLPPPPYPGFNEAIRADFTRLFVEAAQAASQAGSPSMTDISEGNEDDLDSLSDELEVQEALAEWSSYAIDTPTQANFKF
jgi:hypothetical protein